MKEEVGGMEKENEDEGEHGKDRGRDIWRGADDKNGKWEISTQVLWKRHGTEFGMVCRM